jgi:hypothetical protein
MATTIPATFRVSAMPEYPMNVQVHAEALAARLSLDVAGSLAFFSTGSVLPTSDQGPFLLNGITWYVWDAGTGTYVPEILSPLSYRQIAQITEPDPSQYTWWTVLDATGKATDLRYYSGGAWKSIFENKFSSYSDTTAMNVAIQSAVNLKYAFRADGTADQDVVFAAPGIQTVDINLTETYDPNSVFGLNKFIPLVSGYYHIDAKVHLDCPTGSPTGNGLIFALTKNTAVMGNEQVFYPDAGTDGRTMSINTNIPLLVGDEIRLNMSFTITGGSGTWRVSANNTYLSGYLIQKTP